MCGLEETPTFCPAPEPVLKYHANIFVSDYDTMKVIFTNKLFGEEAGQVPENAECWKMLNAGLGDVCKHCPSTMLYGTIAVKENAYNRC